MIVLWEIASPIQEKSRKHPCMAEAKGWVKFPSTKSKKINGKIDVDRVEDDRPRVEVVMRTMQCSEVSGCVGHQGQ